MPIWFRKPCEVEGAARQLVEQLGRVLAFTSRIDQEIAAVQSDLERLHPKALMAAENARKAWDYLAQLEEILEQLQGSLPGLAEGSLAYRLQEVEIARLQRLLAEHSAKHHLYERACSRLASIVALNENFLNQLFHLKMHFRGWLRAGVDLLRLDPDVEVPPARSPCELMLEGGRTFPDRKDLATFSFTAEGHTAENT